MTAPTAEFVELLDRELGRLVGRLRDFSPARYAAAAPPFGSRAEAARHLAEQLAHCGQGVEERDRPVPPRWRRLPDLVPLALADVLAVTGHDLVSCLRATTAGETGWTPTGRRPVAELAAGALAEVVLHRRDLDGSPPLPAAMVAVLAALDPPGPGAAGDPARPTDPPAGAVAARFARVATARCPAYS